MNIRITKRLTVLLLLALGCASCEKGNYTEPYTAFGEVYFAPGQAATYLAGHLKVRYNGDPMELQGGTGRIRVPEGEGEFEFYDESTGEVLLTKTVDIIAGSPERYTLFQPTPDAPLTFLDENAQENEEAAPDGFFKVRIVDYTGNLFFDDKVEIILWRNEFDWITFTEKWVEIGPWGVTIGKDLDEEAYHLLEIDDAGYGFSFRKTDGEKLLTVAGEEFIATEFYKRLVSESESLQEPKKNVFTAYIMAAEINNQNDNFIPVGNKLYAIRPVIFLQN